MKPYLRNVHVKLAWSCPTRVYYFQHPEQYANQDEENSILISVKKGMTQYKALLIQYDKWKKEKTQEKTLDLASWGEEEALEETRRQLEQNTEITLYQAAFLTEYGAFTRIDILEKKDQTLVLKHCIGKTSKKKEMFTKTGVSSDWKEKFLILAFQRKLVAELYPRFQIQTYFIAPDPDNSCPTDGLVQKLKLKIEEKRDVVIIDPTLTLEDLTISARDLDPDYYPLSKAISADAGCDLMAQDSYPISRKKDSTEVESLNFEAWIRKLAQNLQTDTKLEMPLTRACKKCPFFLKPSTLDSSQEKKADGKLECFQLAVAKREGFPPLSPEKVKEYLDQKETVFDIWNYKKTNDSLKENKFFMHEISREDIYKSKSKEEPKDAERQWRQVEKVQTKDSSLWIDTHKLKKEIERFTYPLHFIDFETLYARIPFQKGQKTNEAVAFQFSHHTLFKDGTVEHTGEFIALDQGYFPNFDFIRALKQQLDRDSGTVFRYSDHENTFLNKIHKQIEQSAEMDTEEKEELLSFIKSITTLNQKEQRDYKKENKPLPYTRMVDMEDIVKKYIYDPKTHGKNSIKQVLVALLNRSKFLQEKYSKNIYGNNSSPEGMKSLNFENTVWAVEENGQWKDPYTLLPPIFPPEEIPEIILQEAARIQAQDEDPEDSHLFGDDESLKDGGIATLAYTYTQSVDLSEKTREAITQALKKYCELDTLAMVMLFEAFQDLANS